jgi:uncharacterized protein
MAQASAGLHEDPANLSAHTRDLHRALVSVQEELEAVDWYRQRADACTDAELREVLLHNMREEIEHAAMLLEWLRRNDDSFAEHMSTYLYAKVPIVEAEEAATGEDAGETEAESASGAAPATPLGLTLGSLKGR